ncbi:hypothetical protein MUK42_27250 [Musa troglodytarum]|uniref:Uncharacterized protein n=1 Tax=Musa troglodytarum TaxID=320322 RepID=A0A9E7JTL5_9LILI|nr:hypothetical protein MUK42_27250 [Musa troglodytarum]
MERRASLPRPTATDRRIAQGGGDLSSSLMQVIAAITAALSWYTFYPSTPILLVPWHLSTLEVHPLDHRNRRTHT